MAKLTMPLQTKLEVINQHTRDSSQEKNAYLTVYDDGWHAGVVGLVAGRLARQHGRPAAVGFVDNNQNIRVSLRGVKGFHIGQLLQTCAQHLHGFGGHAGAGGGTVKSGSWDAFVLDFTKAVNQQQTDGLIQNHLLIDGVLSLPALHIGLASRLQRFEPIGQANPACLWAIHDVTVVDTKKLKGGVMRVRLTDGMIFTNAVVFGAGVLADDLQEGVCISVLGQLQTDDYRGGDAVQFVIEDVVLETN